MTAPIDTSFRTPAQMTATLIDTMEHKATTPLPRMLGLGFFGGMWIAMGFVFYVTSQTGAGTAPVGLTKVVGGVVFSTGLILVVLTGADLFTSTTMTLAARAAGRLTWLTMVRHWVIIWLSNFVGAGAVALACFVGGLPHHVKGAWGLTVVEAASGKLHHTLLEAFVLGILCNICVCVAVFGAMGAKTAIDKAVAIVLPVALFVATGMEHSVANMFLIPLGILIRHAGGVDAAAYPQLTVPHFLVGNLLPVTLGNIVGGAVVIALAQWWLHGEKTTH